MFPDEKKSTSSNYCINFNSSYRSASTIYKPKATTYQLLFFFQRGTV